MLTLASLLLAVASTSSSSSSLPNGFYVLDPTKYEANLREDYAWAVQNVPFVDIPLPDVVTAYYYRWRSFRRHIVATPEGYVVTEFLPDVPWAGKYNTIPAAAGHHIMEGRWIHNATYIDDYVTFWFTGGGAPRTYTSWITWAAYQRSLLNGDDALLQGILVQLVNNLNAWVSSNFGDYGGGVKCFWQEDGKDAMEVSISGNGCRPTINAAMYGEAAAIVEVATLAGNSLVVDEVSQMREIARTAVLQHCWNNETQTFAVRNLMNHPQPPSGGVPSNFVLHSNNTFCCDQAPCKGGRSAFLWQGAASEVVCATMCQYEYPDVCNFITWYPHTSPTQCQLSQYCNATNPSGSPSLTYQMQREVEQSAQQAAVCPGNGSTAWPLNETVTVRELLGYMPFYFGYPAPLISDATVHTYDAMWAQLFDAEGFKAPWGLRTAELRHPCYNYSWVHFDCWNGPSWPYETARVLTSIANLLNEYSNITKVTPNDYVTLLSQYAAQHTKSYAINDTASPIGSGHVFEVLHPDDGYWIDREGQYAHNTSLANVGDDYNHSTFVDLVLSGLLGVRALKGRNVLINPLLKDASHFAVDHIKCKGRYLSVVWDSDGTHYDKGAGFFVMVDGAVVSSSPHIAEVTVSL